MAKKDKNDSAPPPVPVTLPASRDLGEALELSIKIYHPKDEKSEYVIHVYNKDGEIEGTLFSTEDHTEESFSNFMKVYIQSKDF